MSLQRTFTMAFAFVIFASLSAVAADNQLSITQSDLITAAQLNSRLPDVKAGKIVLIHVGFHVMYQMGHIPRSQYVGAASYADGMAGLKKLASNLPRGQEIVIYCGCCPWDNCPNIRPAFQALKEMGFTNLKALDIPERFGHDWTAKGYPVVKGD